MTICHCQYQNLIVVRVVQFRVFESFQHIFEEHRIEKHYWAHHRSGKVKMNAIGPVDELVREYLLFRGFVSTLRAFDGEKKADRFKGFQVCC
jgi:hypothetical protein